MMNRAFGFLGMALEELKEQKIDREKVKLFIRLAVSEVQELQQALEAYEAQPMLLPSGSEGGTRAALAGAARRG